MLRSAVRMASNGLKRKSAEKDSGSAPKKAFGHWSTGLKASMEDPALKVESDDQIVIIKDKYPKARFHFLVLPKENISSLKKLEKEHLPLLKHMHKKGKELAEKSSKELTFRLGYHAIPSMSHIHLHVISQDFDSPCLKTKRHWNSFTTEYFVDSKDVMEMLDTKGKIEFDTSKYDSMLKKPLCCHECGKDFSTMPALKQHIVRHVPNSK